MANLSLFGPPFTEKDPQEQLTLIKDARHLRRQKLPEKVRKAPVKRAKTTTKKQKVASKSAFEQLSIEDQIELLKKKLNEKQEAVK